MVKQESGEVLGKSMVFLEVLLWGVFILLVLMNGMTYIFNTDITASIKNLFCSAQPEDIVVDPEDMVICHQVSISSRD